MISPPKEISFIIGQKDRQNTRGTVWKTKGNEYS